MATTAPPRPATEGRLSRARKRVTNARLPPAESPAMTIDFGSIRATTAHDRRRSRRRVRPGTDVPAPIDSRLRRRRSRQRCQSRGPSPVDLRRPERVAAAVAVENDAAAGTRPRVHSVGTPPSRSRSRVSCGGSSRRSPRRSIRARDAAIEAGVNSRPARRRLLAYRIAALRTWLRRLATGYVSRLGPRNLTNASDEVQPPCSRCLAFVSLQNSRSKSLVESAGKIAMKLGLIAGYSGKKISIPIDTIKHAEEPRLRLGVDVRGVRLRRGDAGGVDAREHDEDQGRHRDHADAGAHARDGRDDRDDARRSCRAAASSSASARRVRRSSKAGTASRTASR